MKDWVWASASCKGTSHEKTGTRLQDAHLVFTLQRDLEEEFIVGIVSDGAGSACKGGEGASLLCRSLKKAILEHFNHGRPIPEFKDIKEWVEIARENVRKAAENRDLKTKDFAATLVLVISDGNKSVIGHIGDGCAVVKDAKENEWANATWPEHGEYASTTRFFTDDPDPNIRVSNYDYPITALVIFSDGLERLALDFKRKEPHSPFFEGMCKPLSSSETKKGKDLQLSKALTRYLNSDVINERTDDDKTLVLAVKK